MNKKAYIPVAVIVSAVLMLASVFAWASPCSGLIETVSGKMVHMGCYFLKAPVIILAIVWISIAIDGLKKKKVAILPLVISGLLAIWVTIPALGGLGICANTDMACHTTIWWIRGCGIVTVILGLISAYDPEKQV